MIDGCDGFAAISVFNYYCADGIDGHSMLITSRVMFSLLVATIVFGLFNLGIFGRRKVFSQRLRNNRFLFGLAFNCKQSDTTTKTASRDDSLVRLATAVG